MKTDIIEPEVNLGENIRRIRGVLGISQADLADRIGMPASHLCKYEKSVVIDDETLDKIAVGLGVSAEAIKSYNHEVTTNYIITNNIREIKDGGIFNDNGRNPNSENNYLINPMEKLVQVYEDRIKELKEQVADLRKEVIELKNKR